MALKVPTFPPAKVSEIVGMVGPDDTAIRGYHGTMARYILNFVTVRPGHPS